MSIDDRNRRVKVCKMKREDELLKELTDMIKETKKGQLKWKLICKTTEYNDEAVKPTVTEDGITWTVDECYVSYECTYKGSDFVMITYEMIHTAGDKRQTTNLVFLPPLGIRYFDISTLLPYSVPASNILTYEIHTLWLLLLEMYKNDNTSVELDASAGELIIEE